MKKLTFNKNQKAYLPDAHMIDQTTPHFPDHVPAIFSLEIFGELVMAKSKAVSLEVAEADVEIQQIEAEFAELEEYFGDMGLDDGAEAVESDAMSELEEALKGTEFESAVPEAGSGMTFIEFADGGGDQEMQEFIKLPKWFPDPRKILINKVKKIIARLKKLVKRYKKYAPCIPLVTKTVLAFKAGKYGTALASGYSALRCIRSK